MSFHWQSVPAHERKRRAHARLTDAVLAPVLARASRRGDRARGLIARWAWYRYSRLRKVFLRIGLCGSVSILLPDWPGSDCSGGEVTRETTSPIGRRRHALWRLYSRANMTL